MSKKLLIEDMRKIANERRGRCLSDIYVNAGTKLVWECAEGHQWEAIPSSIKSGRWCRICGIKKRVEARKLSIAEMQRIAAERGGKCLSETYVNSKTKLWWQCAEGHQWSAKPNSIKNGCWCPYCTGNVKGTIEEMQTIAEERGGICLSDTYIDSQTKLWWQCAEGHQWSARPANVKRGYWCPHCARVAKGTLAEIQKIAEERGGKCLSKAYVNSRTKLLWECAEGHQWETTPREIKSGYWCPYCAGKAKGTLAEMQSVDKERGGK